MLLKGALWVSFSPKSAEKLKNLDQLKVMQNLCTFWWIWRLLISKGSVAESPDHQCHQVHKITTHHRGICRTFPSSSSERQHRTSFSPLELICICISQYTKCPAKFVLNTTFNSYIIQKHTSGFKSHEEPF